jgi:hypothetical protein
VTPDRRLLLTLLSALFDHLRRLPGETDPDRVLETLLASNTALLTQFRDWSDLPAAYGVDVPELIDGLCAELADLHQSWQAPAAPEPPRRQPPPPPHWGEGPLDVTPGRGVDLIAEGIIPPAPAARPAVPGALLPPPGSTRPIGATPYGGATPASSPPWLPGPPETPGRPTPHPSPAGGGVWPPGGPPVRPQPGGGRPGEVTRPFSSSGRKPR